MTDAAGKPLVCLAHRGASGHAPENTLAAFEKAVELGADWIELDVFAVENELVVIHDNRLERTTTGTGYVTERGLSYLRGLDAGNGQKIPLLREVLDLTGRRIKINIELKGPDTAGPVTDLVDTYVKNRGWRYEDFLVSSFDHRQVKKAKTRCPGLAVAPNITGVPLALDRLAAELSPFSIHVDADFVTAGLIADIHGIGCPAFVFTANTAEEIKRLRDMGADGVFSNFPDRVRRVSQASR
ncbi:MAG: glycerophosphodiester phosphodiesterase [Thermodesulfobacteriota bacterium]